MSYSHSPQAGAGMLDDAGAIEPLISHSSAAAGCTSIAA
jgi:hypothetical protein